MIYRPCCSWESCNLPAEGRSPREWPLFTQARRRRILRGSRSPGPIPMLEPASVSLSAGLTHNFEEDGGGDQPQAGRRSRTSRMSSWRMRGVACPHPRAGSAPRRRWRRGIDHDRVHMQPGTYVGFDDRRARWRVGVRGLGQRRAGLGPRHGGGDPSLEWGCGPDLWYALRAVEGGICF
jgi:hypothetical protein